MMKHRLHAPKVGVLLAILAMGSLAACEQTVEPEAIGTQRPEQFHEVVAGLDAGFYRVWNVERAQAGAPLPLTSDHPEWTWDRLKGFDNIVAALHGAAGTFHTPIVLAADTEDPECFLKADATDEEREEFADCANELMESEECSDVLVEHWMKSDETHAHCVEEDQ